MYIACIHICMCHICNLSMFDFEMSFAIFSSQDKVALLHAKSAGSIYVTSGAWYYL